jgi:hypothetical protein
MALSFDAKTRPFATPWSRISDLSVFTTPTKSVRTNDKEMLAPESQMMDIVTSFDKARRNRL